MLENAAGEAPKTAAKPKHRHKPRPRPAKTEAMVASSAPPAQGPRPYLSQSPSSGPAAPPPATIVMPLPPPGKPAPAYSPPPLSDTGQSQVHEIHLKCDTRTRVNNHAYTQGTLHLSLIPSEVDPESYADLLVMRIDDGHQSVIRDTTCLSARCSLNVTPGFYELSTQYKHRDQLKLTLDRQTGAFYGHEVRIRLLNENLPGLDAITTATLSLDETGYCTLETPQPARF